MKTIVLFNNKGGVGKTTLTGNVAAYIAKRMNKKVCVIDCDPQCNVTQLFLGDDKTIDLYWNNKPFDADFEIKTLIDIVRPLMEGDASIDANVVPVPSETNRFGVDFVPGHPQFSKIEDNLSRAWGDLTAQKIGGFRITHWLSEYLSQISNRYDYAFVDVGPSLGSINRSVLCGADFFLTPLGADVFSLLGIRNIAQWNKSWIDEYNFAYKSTANKDKESLERYKIPNKVKVENGFIGYTLQQYITKSKKGIRRATVAFEKILNNVPKEVDIHMSPYFAPKVGMKNANLGDVPNLYSIIPLAQSVNAPILDLQGKDGLVGAQYQQAVRYSELIASVSTRIVENSGA